MYNPLLDDLTKLKDDDLETKLTDLNKKYSIALRMGNRSVAEQIAIIIAEIRDERTLRQSNASKKLLQTQNTDLNGLIKAG